jgi:hypothetical protein
VFHAAWFGLRTTSALLICEFALSRPMWHKPPHDEHNDKQKDEENDPQKNQ